MGLRNIVLVLLNLFDEIVLDLLGGFEGMYWFCWEGLLLISTYIE